MRLEVDHCHRLGHYFGPSRSVALHSFDWTAHG